MDVFTFIVAVVAIGCSIPLFRLWQEGRHHGRLGDAQAESLRKEIAGLRERVEVLEKIVTDKSYEVRRQFAELGDD